MSRPFVRCACMVALALTGLARANEPAPQHAQDVLDAVVSRLPQESLIIGGDLIVRKLRGVVAATLRFDILLDWGASPPAARYTIYDHFGDALEQLTLTREPGGDHTTVYRAGVADPSPAPPLTQRIQDTDMSWTDLTLDFLWWPNGRIVGTESVRGRRCHIVEVPAPPSAKEAQTSDVDRYTRVRVWIDQELFVLMQAEAYNAAGVRIRRLWVQSLKKQQGRWMIKDLEVQAYPPVQRTRLRVNSAVMREPL
ncbi:MAG: outer membrane lipoprotein-sorting protein [Verrucomicrobia bacterium]|nr:outer membrane lipoprotein-sorting protein [Verrucomicrobiota bacterium]